MFLPILLRSLTSMMALVAASAACAYPVRAFLLTPELPLAVRLAWFVAAAAAAVAPRASLLTFIVGAALLPTLPQRYAWPPIAVAELWLYALLVPAWVKLAFRRPASGFGLRASGSGSPASGLPPVNRDDAANRDPEVRSLKPEAGRARGAALPASVVLLLALATASLLVVLYPFHLAHDGLWPLLVVLHQFARDDLIVAQSPRHIFTGVVTWVTLAEGIALLWLVVRTFDGSPARGATLVVRALAVAGSAVSASAVYQWWTGAELLTFWRIYDPGLTRVNGTFSDVNGLAAFLALVLCLLGGLAVQSTGAARQRWLALGALTMSALVFTASRAAWAGALSGLLLLSLGLWRYGLLSTGRWVTRHVVRGAAAAAVAAVVLIGVLTAYATSRNVRHHEQRTYFDVVLITLNLNAPLEERLKGRLAFWEAAVAMVAAEPVFGIGISRYYKEVARYAPRQELLIALQENAHNYYLQAAAELGLLGLAAWLAVLAMSVRAAARVAAGTAPPGTRRLALAAGAGIVAYAVCWLTGHPLLVRDGQFVFWPAIGALRLFNRDPGAVHDRRVSASRAFTWIACLAIAASVPWRATRAANRVDLTQRTAGLHGPEMDRDGSEFRWGGDRVTLYVPVAAEVVQMEVRHLAPFPQTVDVFLDGSPVGRLMLQEYVWVPLRYGGLRPPRRTRAKFRRLELRVSPIWRPLNDPRELGVQVRGFSWIVPAR